MAQEDKVIYENRVKEISEIAKELTEVCPVLLKNEKATAYLGVKWYLVKEGYLLTYNQSVEKELEKLKKYMHCAHIDTQEEHDGNDSHKDYFKEVCKNCGKVIREWSI